MYVHVCVQSCTSLGEGWLATVGVLVVSLITRLEAWLGCGWAVILSTCTNSFMYHVYASSVCSEISYTVQGFFCCLMEALYMYMYMYMISHLYSVEYTQVQCCSIELLTITLARIMTSQCIRDSLITLAL